MANGMNPNANNTDKNEAFSGFKVPNINVNALMDSYKKNLEILGLINKMSVEVLNGIAKLQSTFIKQMMMDYSSVMEKSTKPSDAMTRLSEITRDSIVKAIGNGKQISDMVVATSNEISDAIAKRFKESVEESKTVVHK